jgi:hypothetical protein
MARGWVHTVYARPSALWRNEIEGGEVLGHFRTQDEAVAAGRESAEARYTEHVVHSMDGSVAYRNGYGPERLPPGDRPG